MTKFQGSGFSFQSLNQKNGRKFYYSQKLCFDKFFAWKEYNFPSGFLTNTIFNFCQEWQLLYSKLNIQDFFKVSV